MRAAIHGRLDAKYGAGLWLLEDVVLKQDLGHVLVALGETRTGEAHALIVSLEGYYPVRCAGGWWFSHSPSVTLHDFA